MEKWLQDHDKSVLVRSNSELKNIKLSDTEHLLGLFGQSHVAYNDLRSAEDPELRTMTRKALEVGGLVA